MWTSWSVSALGKIQVSSKVLQPLLQLPEQERFTHVKTTKKQYPSYKEQTNYK